MPTYSAPRSRADLLAQAAREAALQVDAGVRGAADMLTFGQADEMAAGANALLGIGGDGGFAERYRANLQRERTRDQYDANHRAIARTAGEVGGAGLLYVGGAGAGAARSAALPPKAKGLLGEVMSAGKTLVSGDLPMDFQAGLKLPSGRRTVADQITARGMTVEAKFGPWARLSRAQREALEALGARYRVDWWLPKHVGRVTGTASATAGAAVAGRNNSR